MFLSSLKFVLFVGGFFQLRQHKDEIRNLLLAETSQHDRSDSGLRGKQQKVSKKAKFLERTEGRLKAKTSKRICQNKL
jgi:hypothetical protein